MRKNLNPLSTFITEHKLGLYVSLFFFLEPITVLILVCVHLVTSLYQGPEKTKIQIICSVNFTYTGFRISCGMKPPYGSK